MHLFETSNAALLQWILIAAVVIFVVLAGYFALRSLRRKRAGSTSEKRQP